MVTHPATPIRGFTRSWTAWCIGHSTSSPSSSVTHRANGTGAWMSRVHRRDPGQGDSRRRFTSRAWRPGGNGALNSSAAPSLSAPVPSTVARCSVQAIARSMSDSPQPKKAPPEMPPACGRPENSIRPVLKPEPVDPSKVFHVVGYHDCARLTLLSPAVHRSATGQLENREAGRVGRAGNGTRRPAARHRIKPRTRASTGDPGQEKSQAVIDMRAWLPKPWWRSVAGCKSRPLSLREMPWASAGLRA